MQTAHNGCQLHRLILQQPTRTVHILHLLLKLAGHPQTLLHRICLENKTIDMCVLSCFCVERLEHLVLSVYRFPIYCLLTPLMSPNNKKCN